MQLKTEEDFERPENSAICECYIIMVFGGLFFEFQRVKYFEIGYNVSKVTTKDILSSF